MASLAAGVGAEDLMGLLSYSGGGTSQPMGASFTSLSLLFYCAVVHQMNDKTAAAPESLPAGAPVMLPWVQRVSRLSLDITMNGGGDTQVPRSPEWPDVPL